MNKIIQNPPIGSESLPIPSPLPNPENQAIQETDTEQVLHPSQDYDLDWHERIERAKRAREEGKKVRANKPSAFTTSRVRI